MQVIEHRDWRGGASHQRLPQRHAHGRTVMLAPAQKGRACSSVLLGQFHIRSEEHTSELQSLMRISYAVFCLKKKKKIKNQTANNHLTSKMQIYASQTCDI